MYVSASTGMSDAAIMELNLPTGIPIVYELDKDLKPVKPMQFLGDEETVRKAMEAVAAQGKVKKWRADIVDLETETHPKSFLKAEVCNLSATGFSPSLPYVGQTSTALLVA